MANFSKFSKFSIAIVNYTGRGYFMSIWRRSTILGLTTAVVFSTFSPVLANQDLKTEQATTETTEATEKEIAEAKVSKDEAIELAKTQVKIPADFQQERVNYNSNHYRSGHGVWDIQFEKTDNENRHHAYIRVSIDAENGDLIGFNMYDSSKESTYPPKVDLNKAKEIAQSFLEKQNKNILTNVKYNDEFEKNYKTPLQGDVRYRFQYDRLENGVPFPMNHVSITVDGNGNVVEYNYNWDESINFNSPDQSINLDEAVELLSKVEFELVYKMPWRKREIEKNQAPYLAYQMKSRFIGLDAETGELINHRGEPNNKEQDYSTVTDEPLKELPSNDLQLNQEEALKRITSTFELPKNAELDNARFEENSYQYQWTRRSLWNFNWRVDGEDERYNRYIRASVDSQTGEILNFYSDQYRPYEEKENEEAPELSPEEAQEKAIHWIKELAPHYTDQIYLNEPDFEQLDEKKLKDIRDYGFSFNRIINGVKAEMDNIHIGIDANTGELVRFYNSMTNIDYPDKTPEVVSQDKAKSIYFSQYDVQLHYHLFNDYRYYGTKDEKENEPKVAVLIYQLVPKYKSQPVFLDAQTGQWRNHETGEVTTLEKIIATDIEGHWAEKQLQLMIDYEAIDVKDGKVMPNKTITRGELIKMLVVSMNGGHYRPYYGAERSASFSDVSADSAYFSYVETAVDRNLIDKDENKFYPDQTITRDEMAELIVRALGYRALAEYDTIFSLNIKDAGEVTNKGAVAIVMGLGIMSSNGNGFNPTKEVTRAVAAMAFYRYLEKRSLLDENTRF
jgi:Zn-dependent metalloprotease